LERVLATLQQWVLFAGVGVVVGCGAWSVVIAPRAARLIGDTRASGLRRIQGRVAGVGAATVLVLVAAWMLRGVVQVMGFRDPFAPLSEDVSFLLFETFWGTVWMAQGAILPLLAIAFWRARGPLRDEAGIGSTMTDGSAFRLSGSWGVALALVLMLVATLALSSHAMGVDSGRPFIVTADAVHTLASGSWIGSLGIILTVGHPTERSGDNVALFAAQLRAFSSMAIVSVSALIAMGVVLAWTHLDVPSSLWTTQYGRILFAKIGVAGLVFAAGFWNWRVGLPHCETSDGAAAVRRRAALEVSLAAGVMLLTAVLVHSAKP
jgi:copper transport protein